MTTFENDDEDEYRAKFRSMSTLEKRIWMEGEVPRFFYKYRALPRHNDENVNLTGLRGLLVKNEVFYSSPLTFNDAHEGIVSYRLSDNPTEVRDAMTAVASRVLNIGVEEAARYVDENNVTERVQLRSRMDGTFETAMRKAGIFSMSKSCRSAQMWAYYASDNAGVCVQLATYNSMMPLALAERVQYFDQKPLVDLMLDFLKDNLGDRMMEILTSKAQRWAHEDEWRLIHRGSDEVERLDDAAISTVILGPRITEFGRTVVREMLEDRVNAGLPMPRIAEAYIDPHRYDFRIRRAEL